MKTFFVFLACLTFQYSFTQLPVPASGKIIRHANFKSVYVDARNIDVWLPDNYSSQKKYAVLYMHDGQMLFDSTVTWNKQEWMADETVAALINQHKIQDCIVVGIWNNDQKRHAEYFPQKALNYLTDDDKKELLVLLKNQPLGDNYLQFLVKEVKPFIDSVYSTYKDRKHTFVAGSSMGGLISMYAICEYPKVFYGAGCLSTHWTGIFRADNNPVPAALLTYFGAHVPSHKKHKIYFDYGNKTLDSLYQPFQLQADEIMKAKGYSAKNWETEFFAGANHSENAWQKRLSIPLEFLMKK